MQVIHAQIKRRIFIIMVELVNFKEEEILQKERVDQPAISISGKYLLFPVQVFSNGETVVPDFLWSFFKHRFTLGVDASFNLRSICCNNCSCWHFYLTSFINQIKADVDNSSIGTRTMYFSLKAYSMLILLKIEIDWSDFYFSTFYLMEYPMNDVD